MTLKDFINNNRNLFQDSNKEETLRFVMRHLEDMQISRIDAIKLAILLAIKLKKQIIAQSIKDKDVIRYSIDGEPLVRLTVNPFRTSADILVSRLHLEKFAKDLAPLIFYEGEAFDPDQ